MFRVEVMANFTYLNTRRSCCCHETTDMVSVARVTLSLQNIQVSKETEPYMNCHYRFTSPA